MTRMAETVLSKAGEFTPSSRQGTGALVLVDSAAIIRLWRASPARYTRR